MGHNIFAHIWMLITISKSRRIFGRIEEIVNCGSAVFPVFFRLQFVIDELRIDDLGGDGRWRWCGRAGTRRFRSGEQPLVAGSLSPGDEHGEPGDDHCDAEHEEDELILGRQLEVAKKAAAGDDGKDDDADLVERRRQRERRGRERHGQEV